MSIPTNELKQEIKVLIMSTLGITDVDLAAISDSEPLFGGTNALTLDSVDAIEIIMAIQRNFGLRIADQAIAREVIKSVDSIAQFITDEKEKSQAQ